MKKVPIIMALVVICAGTIFNKFRLLEKLPFYAPGDGECFYWTESAFHFRHFLMVSEGKGIPEVDYGIQYPEGFNTSKYETPLMDRVYGILHRAFFHNVQPHLFLVYATFIFSTLSIIAVFLAAMIILKLGEREGIGGKPGTPSQPAPVEGRGKGEGARDKGKGATAASWTSETGALLIAAFYAFSPASYYRNSGGGYIREDFALPFIFFSFACFLYCLRKDKTVAATIGSILLVIALAAWHLTQLYVSLFVGGLVFVYFFTKERALPRKSLLIFTFFMVIAAFLLPVAREKNFIFSPAVMLSCGLLLLSYIPAFKKNETKNTVVAVFVILVLLALSFLIQNHKGENYSEVYELIWGKIRFLGSLPENPAKLSFEAKSQWTSAFVSPRLDELPVLLGFTLLFGLGGLGVMIFRKIPLPPPLLKGETGLPAGAVSAQAGGFNVEVMTAYFGACTFILFLMMHRMSVFAVFFLALAMCGLTVVKNRGFKGLVYGGMIICFPVQLFLLRDFQLLPFRPDQNDLKNLIFFLKENTVAPAPFVLSHQRGGEGGEAGGQKGETGQLKNQGAVLSSFELGPSIAVYADRPVVLHPKFESKILRDKVKDVYITLFNENEDAFYALCKKYKANVFVYQSDMVLGTGPGSMKYIAGAMPLKTDSAVFKFHFEPEKLRHFKLVYQNSTYRVFSVTGLNDDNGINPPPSPFSKGGKDGDFGKKEAGYEKADIKYDPVYDPVVFFGLAGEVNPPNRRLTSPATMDLQIPQNLDSSDNSIKSRGDKIGSTIDDAQIRAGLASLQKTDAHKEAGDRFFKKGDYNTAAAEYERALMLDQANSKAAWALGTALMKAGEEKKAEDAFKMAFSIAPEYDVMTLDIRKSGIWIALGNVDISRQRYDRAEKLFKKAAQIRPDSDEAYFMLGNAFSSQEKYQAAEAAFLKAASLNPENETAYEYLGKIYAAQGDMLKASEAVEKALSINPYNDRLKRVYYMLRERAAKKGE